MRQAERATLCRLKNRNVQHIEDASGTLQAMIPPADQALFYISIIITMRWLKKKSIISRSRQLVILSGTWSISGHVALDAKKDN